MLNFRKLKQDYATSLLQEGKGLHDQKKVVSAKILRLDDETIRFSAKVMGHYSNTYESEVEIDRFESETIHSNCDCSYRYDCQHLAALLFYLEEHLDSILIKYSKEEETLDEDIKERIEVAKEKETAKKDLNLQKQIVDEYIISADVLSSSSFFLSKVENKIVKAELALIFNPKSLTKKEKNKFVEFSLALRLPFRSKPLHVSNVKEFLEAVRYEESVMISTKKYFFSLNSFNEIQRQILKIVMDGARFNENAQKNQKIAKLHVESFGNLLSKIHELSKKDSSIRNVDGLSEDLPILPGIFSSNLETPLNYSFSTSTLRFELEYIDPPVPKLLLKPTFTIEQTIVNIDEVLLFKCSAPAMLYEDVYYKFENYINRSHLNDLVSIRDMTIPEPLFGTFVENTLPELKRFADVANLDVIENFVTLPYASNIESRCSMSYLDGELEATLYFSYDNKEVISSAANLTYNSITEFITSEGIIARDLAQEKKIIDALFSDFVFNPLTGTYIAKSEKKIVEFMTDIIPNNQSRVSFECPQNLLDQFIYDKTKFTLHLDTTKKVGYYGVNLKVDGALKGVTLDLLFECVLSKRTFIEMSHPKKMASRFSKILVLDLEKISRIVHIFDEIGIKKLTDQKEDKPLWSLVNIDETLFENLDIDFKMSKNLITIKKQMIGESSFKPSPIPKSIKADLRPYQVEGINWLERLRCMFLNGILADDMGLGKTLQAIVAITQNCNQTKTPSLVVCPTSLLYNWQEEIHKFAPKLRSLIIDGIPQQRKKLIDQIKDTDVIITSYTLMQKDIEHYKDICFAYMILDEAQHIKNRGTRNAKSVKLVNATHKLILTGTPIENSLDELWSLLDFLMPGFLSSYDRFIEKYMRSTQDTHIKNMQYLKRKVAPFILRRMKEDVLKDLPPVSEITYHCQLTGKQLELYKSYAQSAKDELTKLVERDGFHKVQIHVLATLTRLKQICCHPAIFAKDTVEVGDSAKYEMLLELLQTLVDSKHKTVIFSQYTKMLQIMREDFKQRGYRYSYLDGSSKNRLQIVKDFNENEDISVFLVSLKAGGTGLNITGADTVIHYDMWWNPAVENQATDRVHRIGQTKSVSAYKLVTLHSIEEKIVEMQRRKKGLVKKVVSCDDEAISKLTWEDVLELLQT